MLRVYRTATSETEADDVRRDTMLKKLSGKPYFGIDTATCETDAETGCAILCSEVKR